MIQGTGHSILEIELTMSWMTHIAISLLRFKVPCGIGHPFTALPPKGLQFTAFIIIPFADFYINLLV